MIISVTAKDIRRGHQKSCHDCPISIAIQRRLKPEYYSRVGAFSYSVNRVEMAPTTLGARVWSGTLPMKAQDFIHDFDWGRHGRAFRFEIVIPEECRA